MNDSRQRGLLRLAHVGEQSEATGEAMAEQRQRFQRLAREDSAPRAVSSFNLFQTPETLADQVAAMFTTFGRTLEPSAGLGRLYRAIRKRSADCEITLVENAPQIAGELYRMTEGDSRAKLVQADFLECDSQRLGMFDAILMNPPFKMRRDIKHIKHAATLLNRGGRLVAICANGPRQREQLQPLAFTWLELPPASFKESFTNVAAAVVVFDRK